MSKSNQQLGPKPVPAELHFQLAGDQLLQTARHHNKNNYKARLAANHLDGLYV
jgi:hypothetical protein